MCALHTFRKEHLKHAWKFCGILAEVAEPSSAQATTSLLWWSRSRRQMCHSFRHQSALCVCTRYAFLVATRAFRGGRHRPPLAVDQTVQCVVQNAFTNPIVCQKWPPRSVCKWIGSICKWPQNCAQCLDSLDFGAYALRTSRKELFMRWWNFCGILAEVAEPFSAQATTSISWWSRSRRQMRHSFRHQSAPCTGTTHASLVTMCARGGGQHKPRLAVDRTLPCDAQNAFTNPIECQNEGL